jgi:hypothetical protein
MLVQIEHSIQKYSTVLLGLNCILTLHTFLLIVGNSVCLVLLCLISMRRDKVCPLYRVRNWSNTNHLQPLQKPYGPLGNGCTISPYFFWGKLIRSLPSYSRNTVNRCTLGAVLPCKGQKGHGQRVYNTLHQVFPFNSKWNPQFPGAMQWKSITSSQRQVNMCLPWREKGSQCELEPMVGPGPFWFSPFISNCTLAEFKKPLQRLLEHWQCKWSIHVYFPPFKKRQHVLHQHSRQVLLGQNNFKCARLFILSFLW